MKNFKVDVLTLSEIFHYTSHQTVVRIYKKTFWFAGKLNGFSMDEKHAGTLRVEPRIKFQPASQTDFWDAGDSLVKPADELDQSGQQSTTQPFILTDIKKIVYERQPEDVLSIQFGGGGAVLSKRNIDVAAIELFLNWPR